MHQQQSQPFHKTPSGKIFLFFIGLTILGLFTFGGMVVYYSYQLKYGSGQSKRLAGSSDNQFSSLTKRKEKQNQKVSSEKIQKIIRPYNHTFGSGSDVRIIAFLDFGCPFCQKEYPILKEVMEKYEPAVKVVFKHFPLQQLHPNAFQAAQASECASQQDKFWQYSDNIFKRKQLNRSSYLNIAKDLSLNVEQFKSCLDSNEYNQRIKKDFSDGVKVGVKGTPTFIVNGKKIEGVVKKERWKKLILDEIKNSDE